MSTRALDAASESGLIIAGEPLLVMLSGGADSVCLLDCAVTLGARVSALHVNYGLRAESDSDEQHCRALCERLGVPLAVERVSLADAGNLQAEARDRRYALAERHAAGDYASAHTASDQAETVLYRLAVSPGRRALLGMEPRRGRLVRPLLEATRDDTRVHCRERGLEWVEDVSNTDTRFARARVREEVLPALRELNPAAERSIVETSRLLRDEAEVLDAAVDDVLARLGDVAPALGELRSMPPGLARLVLRRLAEAASSGAYSLSRDQADAVLRLGERGGTASLDLGKGLRAVAEYGTLRFTRDAEAAPPPPARLLVPGRARFGDWEVSAALGESGEALLAAAPLGDRLTVRAWNEGDRMRPAGLGGTKTLQDLFTDRKVPRALRHSLPVVTTEQGEIVWVAGVAVGETFKAAPHEKELVSLSARQVS
ncbi:MAG TPA: tRNA lysidine(34) synthetase TilS [Thermoleophilaceae bacterium]|nr:tRNA lysidine(34) synthetase TilS [Thermoleophilaceae bacterium]